MNEEELLRASAALRDRTRMTIERAQVACNESRETARQLEEARRDAKYYLDSCRRVLNSCRASLFGYGDATTDVDAAADVVRMLPVDQLVFPHLAAHTDAGAVPMAQVESGLMHFGFFR